MNIVSLLPAATEMVSALGLEPALKGISFECDYPRSIMDRPQVVDVSIKTKDMTPKQINVEVTALMREGGSLYVIDESLLQKLRPDIILTQNLCQVCAPSGNELSHALAKLDYKPEVIFMSPHSLSDIEGNLMELAQATGKTQFAKDVVAGWRERIDAVKKRVAKRGRRPRTFIMEWVDPIYCSGHWLPEMTDIAGGEDKLARPGVDSVRIEWKDVLEWQPEVLVVAPCGYNQQQAEGQISLLEKLPGWETLPAVKSGRVYPVDANSYFVRPGPRVIDGIEMLEKLFSGIS
jgi:iron complex transport system substrate-binding protein